MFLLCFSILVVFLYIFSPGILSYDSYNQLEQIKTHNFSNWHPFLHTFIEMVLLKIWNDTSVIGLFQITIFSLIWTAICHYNRNEGLKNYLLQLLVILIICFNPINFLYAITLWKDILYSYSILFVCFLLQILVDKKYKVNKKYIVLLGLSLAFMSKIRYNGLYITIVLLAVLMILLFRKVKKHYLLLFLTTLLGIGAISSLDIIFNVENNEKSAIEPKVMQYITFFIKKDKLSKKDLKSVSEIAEIDELLDSYKYSYTDELYSVINHKKYKKNQNKMIKLCLKYTFKHPILSMKFAINSTSFIWDPTFPKDRVGLILSTDITSLNNTDNVRPYHSERRYYAIVNSKINKTLNNDFLKIILYSAALYFYLTIIICIILAIKYKYRTFLILLPNTLNLIVVALSNPIHDIRYIYPNILLFYFVLLILIKKIGEKSKKKIKKSK